jgi:hypothetical protein
MMFIHCNFSLASINLILLSQPAIPKTPISSNTPIPYATFHQLNQQNKYQTAHISLLLLPNLHPNRPERHKPLNLLPLLIQILTQLPHLVARQ